MQFVGEPVSLGVDGPLAITGDGRFPPSKLSPLLNSFSKLPLIRAPVVKLLSLRPYGPVEIPDGREETVDPRGRATPIGSSGSRLCLLDFGGERILEWLRSSVDDSPMLSVPSVSVSWRVKGARCTGTAECTSDEIMDPGLDGRAHGVGDEAP